MESIAGGRDAWGMKPFVISGGKAHCEDETGRIELEPIEGNIVVSRRSKVDKRIAVATHITLTGGSKAESVVINVEVDGRQFAIKRIKVEVDPRDIVKFTGPFTCKVPEKELGEGLKKVDVTLEGTFDDSGKRLKKISFREIGVLRAGESKVLVILGEPVLEKMNINVDSDEKQLSKCLESLTNLEEMRRRSAFSGRARR
jgi:hypothetical protein